MNALMKVKGQHLERASCQYMGYRHVAYLLLPLDVVVSMGSESPLTATWERVKITRCFAGCDKLWIVGRGFRNEYVIEKDDGKNFSL